MLLGSGFNTRFTAMMTGNLKSGCVVCGVLCVVYGCVVVSVTVQHVVRPIATEDLHAFKLFTFDVAEHNVLFPTCTLRLHTCTIFPVCMYICICWLIATH